MGDEVHLGITLMGGEVAIHTVLYRGFTENGSGWYDFYRSQEGVAELAIASFWQVNKPEAFCLWPV